jgi:hypothetical protein
MRPKKQKYKNIKQHKRWQRKGILTKRLLENQRVRKNRNSEPEVVALQNDARKRYPLSEITSSYKKVIEWDTHSYHEESCHLTK